jgi:uncharacterized protein (TIGR03437 family)
LNGDGKPDVIIGYGDFALDGDYSGLTIFFGDGDGGFDSGAWVDTGERPSSFAVSDLDGDGKLDLTVANENSNSLSVLMNQHPNGHLIAVSSASLATTLAPESLVSIFGALPANGTASGDLQVPLASLAGLTVKVRDNASTERVAPILYASPTQVNFQIPPATAPGDALVTIGREADRVTALAHIRSYAPGIFATPSGYPYAFVVRVENDGSKTVSPILDCPAPDDCSLKPIVLDNRPVYLTIFATGIRRLSEAAKIMCQIGETIANVDQAQPVPGVLGLDQVTMPIAPALKNSGRTSAYLSVNHQRSNSVFIDVR